MLIDDGTLNILTLGVNVAVSECDEQQIVDISKVKNKEHVNY